MDNREIMYEKITDILKDDYHPDINTDEEIRKQTLMDYIQQQVSVEPVVKPEIAKAYNKGKEDAVTEIIKQLEEYIKTGNIDFISVSLGWVEKRLRKALKQFSV